jgi:hypothetical protein
MNSNNKILCAQNYVLKVWILLRCTPTSTLYKYNVQYMQRNLLRPLPAFGAHTFPTVIPTAIACMGFKREKRLALII